VGPSGCGKSTLLNLASGILNPTDGLVLLRGEPLQGIAHGLGYVFQTDALLPWKTVKDNIALALRLQKVPEATIAERVTVWIERVGLAGFGESFPYQLSGGMRKRVAIAQALVHEPDLVLMDEPFSALDVQTRNMMENELLALWEGLKKTVLFITHDLEEAIALSDRIVVMSARPGRVKASYEIDLPRPRDLTSVRLNPRYHELYGQIWEDLREEVASSYAAQKRNED
jgi:NitT/TauT family transport system ATP-binding protein